MAAYAFATAMGFEQVHTEDHLLLSLPVLYAARMFFTRAYAALRERTLDMNVLVAVSGQAKWTFSGAAVTALVASFVGMGVAIGVVESIMARLRQPKVPLYLAGGSALALFGLILVLR